MPMIPLCAARDPTDVVGWRRDVPISLARFLSDVAVTAARLPAHDYVVNLCGDRYRFTVGLAAALRRRQVSLLPPSAASEALVRIADAYSGPAALIDPGARVEGPGQRIAVAFAEREEAQEIPAFDPGQVAVVAFTSGSTGQPLPHPKTWGSLARGAVAEATGLGLGGAAQTTLLGTVPPQHMYGLESTVMLALRGRLAVHAARPLYPADIAAALAALPGERVLVTTPVHLRALLQANIDLPVLRMIICATAALPGGVAQQAEARFGAPLHEIYGFTEAGMVASRRSAREECWQALPGVQVRRVGDEVCFSGGHVEREVVCSDRIEPLDARRFLLRGRAADMINVAGKRSSLAHLEHALRSVEGVEDAAWFMPEETGHGVTRPAAFVVAPALDREALFAALRERIDPVFLPRPLYFVQALPRNATGKIPREALVALAAACARGSSARSGVQVLAPDHPVAQGHFPGNPILPGALILDHVIEAAEAHQGLQPCGWTVSMAKFLEPVRPGEDLRIEFAPRNGEELDFECFVGTHKVASGRLSVLLGGTGDPAQGRR